MDTQQKRMSAMHLACPWRGPSVLPTGSIGQAQRQATDFMYSGILAGEASGPIYPGDTTISRQGVGDVTFSRRGVGSVTIGRTTS